MFLYLEIEMVVDLFCKNINNINNNSRRRLGIFMLVIFLILKFNLFEGL